MSALLAWEVLRRAVNALPPVFGTAGVRDPEAICEVFDGLGYNGRGHCKSDGHYLCVECSELSPEAPRFVEFESDGRRDRLRSFWARNR